MTSEGFKKIKIFYLSINGKEPSKNSVGNLDLRTDYANILSPISYEYDIIKWIESCMKESYDKPVLRETLEQYKRLINDITGKNYE